MKGIIKSAQKLKSESHVWNFGTYNPDCTCKSSETLLKISILLALSQDAELIYDACTALLKHPPLPPEAIVNVYSVWETQH